MITTDEYMTKPVIATDTKQSVRELCKLMDEKNIGSLVLMGDGKIKGIVTERDVVRKCLSAGKNPDKMTAEEIMTKEVFTLGREASLMEVAAMMKQHTMRRIIVVENDAPVGIITSRDLIGLLV